MGCAVLLLYMEPKGKQLLKTVNVHIVSTHDVFPIFHHLVCCVLLWFIPVCNKESDLCCLQHWTNHYI